MANLLLGATGAIGVPVVGGPVLDWQRRVSTPVPGRCSCLEFNTVAARRV